MANHRVCPGTQQPLPAELWARPKGLWLGLAWGVPCPPAPCPHPQGQELSFPKALCRLTDQQTPEAWEWFLPPPTAVAVRQRPGPSSRSPLQVPGSPHAAAASSCQLFPSPPISFPRVAVATIIPDIVQVLSSPCISYFSSFNKPRGRRHCQCCSQTGTIEAQVFPSSYGW